MNRPEVVILLSGDHTEIEKWLREYCNSDSTLYMFPEKERGTFRIVRHAPTIGIPSAPTPEEARALLTIRLLSNSATGTTATIRAIPFKISNVPIGGTPDQIANSETIDIYPEELFYKIREALIIRFQGRLEPDARKLGKTEAAILEAISDLRQEGNLGRITHDSVIAKMATKGIVSPVTKRGYGRKYIGILRRRLHEMGFDVGLGRKS